MNSKERHRRKVTIRKAALVPARNNTDAQVCLRSYHRNALDSPASKIVAEKLGHASVNLTLNVYSHTIPSMQHEAASDFEKALCG